MASNYMVRARRCGQEWVEMAMPDSETPEQDAHAFAQSCVNPDSGEMCESQVLKHLENHNMWEQHFTYTAKTRASANKGA